MMPLGYMGYSIAVKVCVHCDRPIEDCKYQRAMRNFHLDTIADTLTETYYLPESKGDG